MNLTPLISYDCNRISLVLITFRTEAENWSYLKFYMEDYLTLGRFDSYWKTEVRI